jgi:hypothetical protein
MQGEELNHNGTTGTTEQKMENAEPQINTNERR